jgi:hypothetical protein
MEATSRNHHSFAGRGARVHQTRAAVCWVLFLSVSLWHMRVLMGCPQLEHGLPARRVGLKQPTVEAVDDEPVLVSSNATGKWRAATPAYVRVSGMGLQLGSLSSARALPAACYYELSVSGFSQQHEGVPTTVVYTGRFMVTPYRRLDREGALLVVKPLVTPAGATALDDGPSSGNRVWSVVPGAAATASSSPPPPPPVNVNRPFSMGGRAPNHSPPPPNDVRLRAQVRRRAVTLSTCPWTSWGGPTSWWWTAGGLAAGARPVLYTRWCRPLCRHHQQ